MLFGDRDHINETKFEQNVKYSIILLFDFYITCLFIYHWLIIWLYVTSRILSKLFFLFLYAFIVYIFVFFMLKIFFFICPISIKRYLFKKKYSFRVHKNYPLHKDDYWVIYKKENAKE